jgi:hypothetical protein
LITAAHAPRENREITLCAVPEPHPHGDITAHTVMFAVGGEFAGHVYAYGQRVYLCLRHAADVYDARRWAAVRPDGALTPATRWLVPHLGRLPLPSLSDHTPTNRRPYQSPHRPRR